MQDTSLFITSDGSHSVRIGDGDLTYHSRHGAIQESRHVFIEAALHYQLPHLRELRVLEIGFGTGLNAFMTYLETHQQDCSIHYSTYELFPLAPELARQLNYPAQLNELAQMDTFYQLHDCPWFKEIDLSSNFSFIKYQQSFLEIVAEAQFDIIYFDAFAPEAQPELWEQSFLQKMYQALKPGGVMTTYCAKGAVKRSLKAVGFRVEKLAGPPGKREMTRAIVE